MSDERIDESKLSVWDVNDLEEYEGVYYFGFSEGEYQVLNNEDLQDRSSKELKIMRNEIFARYGYQFIPEGEMDKHFKAKDWYFGQNKDVNHLITAIEKVNITIIQEEEARRKKQNGKDR